MSSVQVQFRIKTTDPLYAWITQLEDSGESVSEAVRSSLRSQLSQDVSSTYFAIYKVQMQNNRRWQAAQLVLGDTERLRMNEMVREYLGF
jgi:hypothetical protein